MLRVIGYLGERFLYVIQEMGGVWLLFMYAIISIFRPPFRFKVILQQMHFVGVRSLNVALLTGTFTGMVFALQSYYGFRLFGAETLVGPTVALAIVRELGPVITSLMVTGRAGSAIAAELGTMRVTEQIDALACMAIDPIHYLVMPRILAGVTMLPLLTILSNFIGFLGAYVVSVHLLGIDAGMFVQKTIEYVSLSDIFNGLTKSACFGLIFTTIGCYKGFYARGGAEGVGRATTESVVLASILILASDYLLTSLMF